MSFAGFLSVTVGPMFSGKTSKLHREYKRYESLGRSMIVLTPDIDNRYQSVVSAAINHDRSAIPAIPVGITNLLAVLDSEAFADATVIGIDEAQFFKGCLIPFVVAALAAQKQVIVVGLNADAEGEPFGDILALMAKAEQIELLSALCKRCGDGTEAFFSRALGSREGQVAVGGAEMYEAVCRTHYMR